MAKYTYKLENDEYVFYEDGEILKTPHNAVIKTSNEKLFKRIRSYLRRQKAFCVSTCQNGLYAITIYHLDDLELYYQIYRTIRHFHLSPKQQGPLALAA